MRNNNFKKQNKTKQDPHEIQHELFQSTAVNVVVAAAVVVLIFMSEYKVQRFSYNFAYFVHVNLCLSYLFFFFFAH